MFRLIDGKQDEATALLDVFESNARVNLTRSGKDLMQLRDLTLQWNQSQDEAIKSGDRDTAFMYSMAIVGLTRAMLTCAKEPPK